MDGEGRPTAILYNIIGEEPCCNRDETEVGIKMCTCFGCGDSLWNEAISAGASIGDANRDGHGDAFRHCYGSCKIARNCGRVCASVLGWGHEIWEHAVWFSSGQMDIHNNSQGREVASSKTDCATGCLDLLYGGRLRVDNQEVTPRSRGEAEEKLKESGLLGKR